MHRAERAYATKCHDIATMKPLATTPIIDSSSYRTPTVSILLFHTFVFLSAHFRQIQPSPKNKANADVKHT
jgi:hypothetical protein